MNSEDLANIPILSHHYCGSTNSVAHGTSAMITWYVNHDNSKFIRCLQDHILSN